SPIGAWSHRFSEWRLKCPWPSLSFGGRAVGTVLSARLRGSIFPGTKGSVPHIPPNTEHRPPGEGSQNLRFGTSPFVFLVHVIGALSASDVQIFRATSCGPGATEFRSSGPACRKFTLPVRVFRPVESETPRGWNVGASPFSVPLEG